MFVEVISQFGEWLFLITIKTLRIHFPPSIGPRTREVFEDCAQTYCSFIKPLMATSILFSLRCTLPNGELISPHGAS